MCDCDICTGKVDPGECQCGYPLDIAIDSIGVKFCTNPDHPYVVCSCGTRMCSDAKYNKVLGRFSFFRCPHCFKRW